MRKRAWVVPLVILSGFIGCIEENTGSGVSGGDCVRAPEETFEVGAVIRIGEIEPPCRIEFYETGVVLRGDPAGARPDPGSAVVRDSRGRYYTANAQGFPSVLSLWSPEGEYLKSFSGPGDGPGELSTRGGVSIHVDGHDRLHVRDGGIRWSIFDEEQRFVRSVPAALSSSRAIAFLNDGTAVSAATIPRDHYFTVLDSTGAVVTSIGPVDATHLAEAGTLEGGAIVLVSDSSFWATPPVSQGHSPVGYRLEEWSTSGELLRAIERDVSWFPRNWPPPPRGPESNLIPSRPIQVSGVRHDGTGLLVVSLLSESSNWRPVTLQEFSGLSIDERAGMYETRLEVIDIHSGTLLVSQVVDRDEYPGGGLIPGTRIGFQSEVGEDLIPIVRLKEFRLVAR